MKLTCTTEQTDITSGVVNFVFQGSLRTRCSTGTIGFRFRFPTGQKFKKIQPAPEKFQLEFRIVVLEATVGRPRRHPMLGYSASATYHTSRGMLLDWRALERAIVLVARSQRPHRGLQ